MVASLSLVVAFGIAGVAAFYLSPHHREYTELREMPEYKKQQLHNAEFRKQDFEIVAKQFGDEDGWVYQYTLKRLNDPLNGPLYQGVIALSDRDNTWSVTGIKSVDPAPTKKL